MSHKFEIIVCNGCAGSGVLQHEELVNYHTRDYDYWSTQCPSCEGSGLLKKTTTISYEPYKPNTPRPRNET